MDNRDNRLLRPDIRTQLSGLFANGNKNAKIETDLPLYGPPIRFYSTQSSQTEFAVRLKRKPSLAEIHTLSYYNLSDTERNKHLKRLMSGDAIYTDYEYDPCIEFINDVRKSKKNEISYITVKRSIGCQTLFIADDLEPNKTQTATQTPTPAKQIVTNNEQELRAEFRAKNKNSNKQKAVLTGPHIEFQSCPEEWKSAKTTPILKLSDISLYSVFDKFLEKNKNSHKPQYLNQNELRKQLSKSTCELTSVVKNSTDVSSKAMGKNLKPEKFSIQINIPSRIQNLDNSSNQSKRDEALMRVQEEINVKPTGKYKRNQSEGPGSGHKFSSVGTSTNSDYQRKHSSGYEAYNDEELFESNPRNFQLDNSSFFKPATILIDRHRASSVSKSEALSPRFQTSSTLSFSKPNSQKKYFNFDKETLATSVDVEDGTLIDVDFDSYNNLSSASSAFIEDSKEKKRDQESDEEVIDVDFSVYDEDNSFYKYENISKKVTPIILSTSNLNRITPNDNEKKASIDLNSSSTENDPELIKNIRERIASKTKKNLAMDLLGFDPKLRYSWLNSFTPNDENSKKKLTPQTEIPKQYTSTFEMTISKPQSSSSSSSTLKNENNYLVPVVRKPQMPVKYSGENVNSNNKGVDKNKEDSTLKPTTISIPMKPNITQEQTNVVSNTNKLPKEPRYVKNTLNNTNNESRKIHKIISSLAEKELEKIGNRIEKRNVRVPELLEDLALAEGNEKTKLEKELNLLMRKYKFDKKKFRDLKKPNETQQYSEDMSTSDEATTTDPHIFRRDPNRFTTKPSKLKEKTRLEKEIKQFMIENNYISQQESSGYSSYEDSTHNSKSQSMESLLSDSNETKEVARAAKLRRSLSLTKSPTVQSEFVRKTIRAVEKNKSKMLPNGQMRWEASKLDEISREYLEANAV